MASKFLINNRSFGEVKTKYMGNITYSKNDQRFISGENFEVKDIVIDPIHYTIAKDVFSLVVNNKLYRNIFDNIREEKRGVGSADFFVSALGANDFVGTQSLSAVGEDDTYRFLIGLSDTLVQSDFSDLVLYSFSSKVSFSEGYYWVYNNGVLSSQLNPETFNENHFFYFKFLDGKRCNIIKQLDNRQKFLTFDGLSSFTFEDSEDENLSRFTYSYNSQLNNILLGVESEQFIIGFDSNANVTSLELSSMINEDLNTFNLDNKNALNISESLRHSFLPYYGNKNSIAQTFRTPNMGLFTHNYKSNIENNSNYITLKNNLIYDGKYSLIDINNSNNFRKYTSINSGIRGNSGYNNFVLSYNSDWYKYEFKPDKQTYFNVPFELKGYSQININDCKLVENGATGGNSPLNADKFYKKLYEYSDFKNTGKTPNVDNAKYLCSWLYYNPLFPRQSIWLDRYYNPDVVTKLDALSEVGWNMISSLQSFSTSNDLIGRYESYYKEFDKDRGIFDVESQLTIQPNALYMYEKIGTESSKKLHSELDHLKLDEINDVTQSHSNQYNLLTKTSYNDEEFSLNIVLNKFDIDLFKGNKVFGNRTISLTVDKDFSPYNLSVDNDTIHYYDFDYNHITSLNLSSQIDDIIFTDDFNKFFVDCGGTIFTVESLDFVTNQTDTLSSLSIADIKYFNQKLYVVDDTNQLSSFSPDLDELVFKNNIDGGLFIITEDGINSRDGKAIDYGDSNDIYTLSSNQIFYQDISTPIISSDGIIDFYVDKNDIVYVLKSDKIFKISNQNLTEVISEKDITPNYQLSSFDVARYQRNGEILEYIEIVDKDTVSNNITIHRYDKNLNHIESFNRTIIGTPIKVKKRFNTKYLEKDLSFKVTLFNLFNYYKKGDVELKIDRRYIDESETSIINFVFSNTFGTITIYYNGSLIDIFKFDTEKYFFSNTLRDNKIFIGGSFYDDENTISDIVTESNNDMISGEYEIKNISIYDKAFNYFDVINYNRIYRELPNSYLIIPIKTRAYIEEIAGFYNQNKNIRKSEFSSINIYGVELTEDMKQDVNRVINDTFNRNFVNLKNIKTNFIEEWIIDYQQHN